MPDGARLATARMSSMVSRETGVSRNARIERRVVMARSTIAAESVRLVSPVAEVTSRVSRGAAPGLDMLGGLRVIVCY
ncbi:hypothetical protein D3C72_2001420 [compost metagenome]